MVEKEEKRKHGVVFKSKDEIKKVLYPGEKAVVVEKKNNKGVEFELYGEPSREEDEIQKLQTGAERFYRGSENIERIIVLSPRIIAL